MRAAPLGRIGQGFALIAFPCLFAPAFLDATQPELTNYIPLIRHPAYDLGLLLLAAGILAPVSASLSTSGTTDAGSPLTVAMSIAGFVYFMALFSFAVAGVLLARAGDLMVSRDMLFWGGGHLMQFVYAIVLLTNWRILAVRSLGKTAVDDAMFRVAVVIVGVMATPEPSSTWSSTPSRMRSTRRSACCNSASPFRPSSSPPRLSPTPARGEAPCAGPGATRRSSRSRRRSPSSPSAARWASSSRARTPARRPTTTR